MAPEVGASRPFIEVKRNWTAHPAYRSGCGRRGGRTAADWRMAAVAARAPPAGRHGEPRGGARSRRVEDSIGNVTPSATVGPGMVRWPSG